ncbi:MAG: aldo/keto reductase [Dongiaceae bacterium]
MSSLNHELAPGYFISRLIKGSWQLSSGHSGGVDAAQAIEDMAAYIAAGIFTFDMADIYTGVEELVGSFIKKYRANFESGQMLRPAIHTKYVPDLDALAALRKRDVESIIDRSLKRLNVEILDLVQFHWWDYAIPRYVETAGYLNELRQAGKIRHLGLTNFDGQRTREIAEAGIPIISTQVQYSLLDRRPAQDLSDICRRFNIKLLCYGTVAGGFLSSRYLGAPEIKNNFENRSLIKYKLIIDECGGWEFFQELLALLNQLAQKHQTGIAEIATRYVLDQPLVAAAIIGAKGKTHLANSLKITDIELAEEDRRKINLLLSQTKGPSGPVYALERDRDGPHGRIMRYNLNKSG